VLQLVVGLSTGHKIGLAVVAAVFVAFALSASFLAPRRWPDFPGRHGLSTFVIVSLVLFAAMLAAVLVFGREGEEAKASEASAGGGGAPKQLIEVKESEWKIQLPATKELSQGQYTFHVTNVGKVPHDFVVAGPQVSRVKTPAIPPGKSTDLIVPLATGNYTVYCSIPGHRKLGMEAQISVG
jgi:uncharacterized cupredoxin-like copper-binding protein